LEYDYLGGSGSRGYGKVKFKELEVVTVIGEVSDEVLEKCQNILND
jgi:CRISPR-associated protein Csm3